MAQRALDANRPDVSARIEETGDAHNRVELQQRERGGGVIEIHLPLAQLLCQCFGEGVDVHLEPDRERRLGADSRTYAAVPLPGNGLVQLQRVTPERFITERIEAEGLPSIFEH